MKDVANKIYFTGFGYLKYVDSDSVKIGKGHHWHYICSDIGFSDISDTETIYDIVQCDGDNQYYYTVI